MASSERGLKWREHLVAAQQPSSFDRGQLFVPWQDMIRITHPSNIGPAELELLGMQSVEQYFNQVRHGVRLLCILIYIRLTNKFSSLLSHGFKDDSLPLRCDIEDGTITARALPDAFSTWKQSEMYDFYDAQWKFNAPILQGPAREDEDDALYHQRTILPFHIEGSPETTLFSKVWKVKIHASHAGVKHKKTFWPYESVYDRLAYNKGYRWRKTEHLALKESIIDISRLGEGTTKQEALNERDVYRQMSKIYERSEQYGTMGNFRRHFTEPYMAFQRHGLQYIILPWAEEGSLGDFWRKRNPREFNKKHLRDWTFYNVVGLVGALKLLHFFRHTHGDLKPGNILIFPRGDADEELIKLAGRSLPPELGVLKIADYGTVRVSSLATMARTRDNNTLTGAQRYAPPEYDRNKIEHDSPRSRLYDVWSMGCIFLELLIWTTFGPKSLERFSKELEDPPPGRFWVYGAQKQIEFHPAVKRKFDQLKVALKHGTSTSEKLDGKFRQYLSWLRRVTQHRILLSNIPSHQDDGTAPEGRRMLIANIPSTQGDGTAHQEGSSKDEAGVVTSQVSVEAAAVMPWEESSGDSSLGDSSPTEDSFSESSDDEEDITRPSAFSLFSVFTGGPWEDEESESLFGQEPVDPSSDYISSWNFHAF